MKRYRCHLLIVLMLAMLAPLGHAAGPFVSPGLSLQPIPSGSGARALGQGNAFIGVADDATAASWNPGGLAQLEAPEISFALDATRLRSGQNFADHPEAETTSTARQHGLNYLSAVWPIRLAGRHAVVSLNWLKQYNFDRNLDYRLTQPQNFPLDRTETVRQEVGAGALTVLAPALAIDVCRGLSLGAAVNIWNDAFTGGSSFHTNYESIQTTKWVAATGMPDQIERTRYKDSFVVDQGYSLTLGAYYRLDRAWSFGVVVKPPHTLTLSHTMHMTKDGTGFLVPQTQRSRSSAELHMPLMVGGGLAYRFSDALMAALDLQWTQWSEYSYEEGGTEVNPLNGMSISEFAAGDTVAVRSGLEYVIINAKTLVPLRCGLAYEQAPTLAGVDEYYIGTLGAGYQIGPYMFDVAYELRRGSDLSGRTGSSTTGKSIDELRHRLLVSLIYYF